MRFLIIGLLLLAACQSTVTGIYAGKTQNHLLIIKQYDYCARLGHEQCEYLWYCAARLQVAKEGDVVRVPRAWCKDVIEEVRE
jgi:hypothetical protein